METANDINDMVDQMEARLRVAMEPLLSGGGRSAVFARLMLAVVPVWTKAFAWENSTADGAEGMNDLALAAANVIGNMMSSTCKTMFEDDGGPSEWKDLVNAYDQAIQNGKRTITGTIPKRAASRARN